ncbi:NadS family protein [Vreelandella sp. EE27]
MHVFNELKDSLEEAVQIKEKRSPASRVTRFEVADVKQIRTALDVSQAEFAQAMGTSVDTVKSWESKRRNPTGLAAKVLATIQENPAFYQALKAH